MGEDLNIDIASLLENEKYPLSDRDKRNLVRLFELTQYLLDDDSNLTKRLNLAKKAKDIVFKQMEEMFEEDLEEMKDELMGGRA